MRVIVCLICLSFATSLQAQNDEGDDRGAMVVTEDPFAETVMAVKYLEQNWLPGDSVAFYFTPQGSQLIPYEWFLALEQRDTTTLFRDDQNILKFRYLPQHPGPMNPDGLPVGFVRDPGRDVVWLGLTCAACHTAEIHYKKVAYRIDGAPAQADIQAFFTALLASVQKTTTDPDKFERFAGKVLRENNTPSRRADLKDQMKALIAQRTAYGARNFRGFPDLGGLQAASTHPSAFGRLDAVDAILNEVYNLAAIEAPGRAAQGANRAVTNSFLTNAPVSYPFLWDTPQHDWVEWLGIAKNGGPLDVGSLSRNVGEVIGVFGNVSIPETPAILPTGYASSVKISSLRRLEQLLESLWSPEWPEGFPALDQTMVSAGKQIYYQKCKTCHEVIKRDDPRRTVEAKMRAVGTDPQAHDNFFNRTGPSGRLANANVTLFPGSAKIPAVANGQMMLSHVVIGTIVGQFKSAPHDALSQVTFQQQAGVFSESEGAKYKGRPLNGIWATAPFLHNGSVPNLDALLRPLGQRPKSFAIGSRSYDPVKVGFSIEGNEFPRFNVLDDSGEPIVGNSNAGHEGNEYGTELGDVERLQLIEFLKSL